MEPSALTLVIAKGPREGETLEFRPGSKIRLGRVVRGNNLPIKDDGISSKHLVIESESDKWVLRDLGSSNGTIVNSTKVPPETPLELRDGDEIKIGEYTSITVKIDCYEESRLRRNPRRGAAAVETSAGPIAQSRGRRGNVGKENEEKGELKKPKGDEIEVVQEGKGELEKPKSDEIGVVEKRRRGRPPKARVLKSEVEPPPAEENYVRPASTRRTRSSKNEELVENSGVGGEGLKLEPMRTRGSSRRKNAPEEPVCDKVDIVEHGVVADSEGVKLEPQSTFGSSRRKNVEEELPESVCDKVEMPEQRNMGDHIVICAEADQASKGLNIDQEIHEEARRESSGDQEDSRDGSGFGVRKSGGEDGSANASSSGVKESVDLEKMTMGQWFDFLEVYLVKQITDETEGAIAEMIEKAKRTGEYIAKQKTQESMPE